MPGELITGGVFLWLPFFAQALRRRSGANSAAGRVAAKGRMPGVKKVTRSPQGEWKLCISIARQSVVSRSNESDPLARRASGSSASKAKHPSSLPYEGKTKRRQRLAVEQTASAASASIARRRRHLASGQLLPGLRCAGGIALRLAHVDQGLLVARAQRADFRPQLP